MGEDDQSLFDIVKVFPPGEDEFSRGEDQDDDPGVFDPVHEARELFGLILDIFHVERDNDLVEVDVPGEIAGTDHVGDRDPGLFEGFKARSIKRCNYCRKSVNKCLLVAKAGQYDLAR